MTTPPSLPNFNPDAGARLATDRFDFEKHTNGTDFRHNATQIDLSPPIIIGTQTATKVQDAIAQLTALITSTLPDATTSSKGVIQLAGDIAGTATNITVARILGRPLSTLPPATGDALIWNGASWAPAITNSFTASGDLSGNNISQSVIGLTGTSSTVAAHCNLILFDVNSIPQITQQGTASANGADFILSAQPSSNNGGNVIISGGPGGISPAVSGGVSLKLGTNSGDNLLQLSEVVSNQRVLSLLNPVSLTTTDMPSDTGDMVIYIHDAALPPDTGTPRNGVIVYSSQNTNLVSELHVKQSDGTDFIVGSAPNPSVWGPDGYQIVTVRSNPNFGSFVTSPPGFAPIVTSFSVPDESTVKVDVVVVGKELAGGSGDAAQFNLSMGFVRSGGGFPAAIGTLTSSDPRTTAGASSWTLPTITLLGNFILVNAGFSTTSSVNWTFATQFTVVTG